MKKLPLQLLTLDMENGQRVTFVGGPLLPGPGGQDRHVEGIRFSNVREIPGEMTVAELIDLVDAEAARVDAPVH